MTGPAPSNQHRPLDERARQTKSRRALRWLLPIGGAVLGSVLTLAWQKGPEAPIASPDAVAGNKRPPRTFIGAFEARSFLRGDLHAHSARSDGDSAAEAVIAHYRDRGYHFFALTDHNKHLDITRYRHLETDSFVLLGGEEVTMAASGLPIHVNALCTERTIGGAHFEDRVKALQWAVSAINAQGGVALINHPNFHSALDAEHILAAKGAHLLEIYNGHPHVYSKGRDKRRSVEAMWDTLLDANSQLAPAAVDDMHMLSETDSGVPKSRPATGWVEVFGDTPNAVDICSALKHGRLYATNGPQLSSITLDANNLTLTLADDHARVEFVTNGGRVLADVETTRNDDGLTARYTLRGDERWVRARVTDGSGKRAWTQAYRTGI